MIGLGRRGASGSSVRRLASLVAAIVVAAACTAHGDVDTAAAPATPPPTSTATPAPTATPTPTPPPPTVTAVPPTPTPTVTECIRRWPLRLRAAQLLLPLATVDDLAAATALVADTPFGGVTVLGDPDERLAPLLAELQAAAAVPLIVAIDEEGGPVQRLAGLLGPVPAAADLAEGTPEEAAQTMGAHGEAMAELGITMVLAPVVDVGSAPPIGRRSFGDDAATVVSFAGPVARALRDVGLTPVLKHFPGHGRASADSHLAVAETPPLDELRAVDLEPYRELLDGGADPAVMVAHLVVPGLTDGVPATVSPAAVDGLLRTELGFDGLVVSDAMNMAGLTDVIGDRRAATVAVLAAGVDLVIAESVDQVPGLIAGIVAAVDEGALTEASIDASVERVLADKGVDPC